GAGRGCAPPMMASFSVAGPSVTPAEAVTSVFACTNQTVQVTFIDFSGSTDYQDNFHGVLRPNDIKQGTDLAGGGRPSLNFTGSAGSGGSTWLTVFESSTLLPEDACRLTLSADILFSTFNNSKGAGLLALFNTGAGKKGLALLVFNNGNTDSLRLATIEQAGKVTVLDSVSLGNGIKENLWYRLTMDIFDTTEPTVHVTGNVFRHTVPTNPNSPLEASPFGTLTDIGALPTGVESTGDVGLVARAVSAVVDLSVTNFTVTENPPPP